MIKKFTYTTSGVCSKKIDIEIDNEKIVSAVYTGGCSGNTQGVSALVKGLDINEAIAKLSGIRCGFKPTSCPDQLAKALELYKNNNI